MVHRLLTQIEFYASFEQLVKTLHPQQMQGELSLGVSSVVDNKVFKKKYQNSNNENTVIEKIIELDKGGHAIILKEDPNKSVRFLYLCLLMSKKNNQNLQTLISKLSQIKQNYSQDDKVDFLSMSDVMQEEITPHPQALYEYLVALNHKMAAKKYEQIFVLKSLFETKIIDPLLIMVIRVVADQYNMVNALDCQTALTLGQIELLLNKFFVDKGAITNQRNKYVIFWSFDESEVAYFRDEKRIPFETEEQSYEDISDAYPVKYESFIMVEKVYSLLDLIDS